MLDLTRRVTLLGALLGLLGTLAPDLARAQIEARQWSFGSMGGRVTETDLGALVAGGASVLGVTSSAGRVARFGVPASLGRGAPSGTIVTTSLPAGQAGSVTALLNDDVGVVSATLVYEDSDTLVPIDMVESVPGTWSATLPAGALTVKGLRFFLEVRDASSTTRIPAVGAANLSVRVSNYRMFSVSNQFALRGVSLEPNDDDPLAVFNELGAYDTTKWRYGTYDGAQYDEPSTAEAAAPGQGFWIIGKQTTAIDVTGASTNRAGNFQIQLHPGFNQIANPFAFPVPTSSITLASGVEANFIAWDGTGYQPLQTTLQPFTGYWINNSDAAVRSISIPPVEGSPGAVKVDDAPWVLAEGQAGWSYEARATVGVYHDGNNRIGQLEQATTAIDAFDFHDAPPPPGGYVSLSFVREEHRLLTDFVSTADEGGTWTMALHSDQTRQPFAVDFTASGSLDPQWEVRALDETGSQRQDLREQPRLTGIVGAGERRWIVVAGPASYVDSEEKRVQTEYADGLRAFALRGATPNPFDAAQGTTFSLALPTDAHVTLKVYDLRGRFVRTLVDEMLSRGARPVHWDGSDERGRPVAAGVYFARMQAADTRSVQKVVVSR